VKKPKILVVNSFSENIGDLAILQTMVEQISPLASEITVHCSDPEKSSSLCNAKCRSWALPVYKSYPSYSFSERIEGLRTMYRLFISMLMKKNMTKTPHADDFLRSDVVISAGGGFISSDYGYARPYFEMLLAKLAGKKVVIYAQSIGPFRGIIDRTISSFMLRMADLITLREGRSKKLLHELGVKKVYVTADSSFAFPPPPKTKRRKEIIICPRKWTKTYSGSEENYLEFLNGLAKALLQRGWKVTVLPTAQEDLGFHALLDMPQDVEFVNQVLSPELTARIISRSEFLVSSRMHPVILGSLTGTPFFAMGWEFKLSELSASLGAGSVPANKLDQKARNFILHQIDQREKIADDVECNVLAQRKKAMANPEILAAYLSVWGMGSDCKA
jgi:colanic acid/amylovoran biosynthesis protein